MKRLLVVVVGLVGALSLTGCSAPDAFTPDGIRDEVSHALPQGWRITGVIGEDAGGCAVTCIAHATLTITAPRGDLAPRLRAALVRHGWSFDAVHATDRPTRNRYPLAQAFDKEFHDRDGRTGSYELIPRRVGPTEIRVFVEIDAHDL